LFKNKLFFYNKILRVNTMKKILFVFAFCFLGLPVSYAQEEIQFLAVIKKNYPRE